jgi:hypothetical protein
MDQAPPQQQRLSARSWAENSDDRGGSSTYLKLPPGVPAFSPNQDRFPYNLSIIPYTVGQHNPNAPAGSMWYEYSFFVHRKIGADESDYICMARTFNKACSVCEYLKGKQGTDHPWPKHRQLWDLYDLTDNSSAAMGLQVWDFSYHLFGKQLKERILKSPPHMGYEYFADPSSGLNLATGFKAKAFGSATFYEASSIDFTPRGPVPPQVLAQAIQLEGLIIPIEYDALRQIFYDGSPAAAAAAPVNNSFASMGGYGMNAELNAWAGGAAATPPAQAPAPSWGAPAAPTTQAAPAPAPSWAPPPAPPAQAPSWGTGGTPPAQAAAPAPSWTPPAAAQPAAAQPAAAQPAAAQPAAAQPAAAQPAAAPGGKPSKGTQVDYPGLGQVQVLNNTATGITVMDSQDNVHSVPWPPAAATAAAPPQAPPFTPTGPATPPQAAAPAAPMAGAWQPPAATAAPSPAAAPTSAGATQWDSWGTPPTGQPGQAPGSWN